MALLLNRKISRFIAFILDHTEHLGASRVIRTRTCTHIHPTDVSCHIAILISSNLLIRNPDMPAPKNHTIPLNSDNRVAGTNRLLWYTEQKEIILNLHITDDTVIMSCVPEISPDQRSCQIRNTCLILNPSLGNRIPIMILE